MDKIKTFFKDIYAKIIGMDDSPHHIAFGFGIGVFLGILPFTGALASVALAVILRVNKAAALLGSLLTNTWLSVVTFVAAGRIGCWILGYSWGSIYQSAHDLIFKFSWGTFLGTTTFKILMPLLIGYLIIGALCGLLAYWVLLALLKAHARANARKNAVR